MAPQAGVTQPLLIRVGEHASFTRIVFDLPQGRDAEAHPLGPMRWEIRIQGVALVSPAATPARLVLLQAEGGTALLQAAPDTRVWRHTYPGQLVLDVLDAAPLRPAMPASANASPVRHGSGASRVSDLAGPAKARLRGRPALVSRPVSPTPALDAAAAGVATGQNPAQPDPNQAVANAIAGATDPAPPPSMPSSAPAMASAGPVPTGQMASSSVAQSSASPPFADPARRGSLLPFAAGTGAAAFRRGDRAVVVFDEPRPIPADLLATDLGLRLASVDVLADATVLRLPMPTSGTLHLERERGGWRILTPETSPATSTQARAIASVNLPQGLRLDMDRPGRAVTIPDPDTGGLLLVGTALGGPSFVPSGAPQAVLAQRRTPNLTLLATWQGVAVVPHTDDLALRQTADGFLLEVAHPGAPPRLAEAGALAEAAKFSRIFDLPPLPIPALDGRLRAARLAATAAPAKSRGPARLDAAEAMLALGMGAEAEAVVNAATEDDPRLLADPRAQALGGASALLAGRLAASARLDAPMLSDPKAAGADELALWRGLRLATLSYEDAAVDGGADSAEAAALIAPRAALLASYPAPLHAKLLPSATEALLHDTDRPAGYPAGVGAPAAVAAARALLGPDPVSESLEYARALLDFADGKPKAGTDRLQVLARSADRDLRARAAPLLIERALAAGALTSRQAADALDALTFAWRGDDREFALRLRLAALRERSGDVQAALAQLREAADPVLSEGWPGQSDRLHSLLAGTFSRALARNAAAPMPPLAFVSLVEDNADLLPPGAAGEAVADRLADRLIALDLPERAAATLDRLVDAAPAGSARAALGVRLAEARLAQGDAQAALMALSRSTADPLPPSLGERRVLLFANASAAQGKLPPALEALDALGTPAAWTLGAELHQKAGRWGEAAASWRRLTETLPPTGPLDPAQTALVLKLATAAAQAGEQDLLDDVRQRHLPRVASGRDADLLRVLTAPPVRAMADLARVPDEIAAAREAAR